MIYIGNFASWIDPSWENLVGHSVGQARPRDWPPINAAESAEYKKYYEAGYDLNAINWWVYEKKDINLDIMPPWTENRIHWWFVKMLPGQFMPMHVDPHVDGLKCNRYWVALQDYVPGHIFVYRDKMVSNYQIGDVFKFDFPDTLHGAANISHTCRITLLITEYL